MDTVVRNILKCSAILPVFILSDGLFAAEVNYGASIVLTSYDNVSLIREPVGDEFSSALRGVFSYSENTSEHLSRLNIDAQTINYHDNQLDDEVDASLTGESTIIIRPRYFEWYVSDVFSRVTINPLEAESSANLINTNAFLTGPNVYFRLSKQHNLNFTVRAENYLFEQAQQEDSDNNRLTSTASFINTFRPGSEFSLNFDYSIVDYKNENLNSNFDRADGFLGFEYERGIYSVNAEAGYTNINFEDSQLGDTRQPRYLFALSTQRTRTSTLRLEFQQATTDTSTSLLDQLDDENFEIVSNTSNSDLYEDTGANISYRNVTPLSNFSFQLGTVETRYNQQKELNVDTDRLRMEYVANMNPRSAFTIGANLAKSVYTDLDQDRTDDDTLYSLSYRLRFQRTMSLNLTLEDETRDSTIDDQSYDDFRIRLSLEYTSL